MKSATALMKTKFTKLQDEAMNLVQEFSYHATLKQPLPVGAGPIGTRMYYDVTDGEIKGDRIREKLLGGGEWGLVGPDGFLRSDVRLQVETHDGAYLYIQYVGLLELNEAVKTALSGGAGTATSVEFYLHTVVGDSNGTFVAVAHTAGECPPCW